MPGVLTSVHSDMIQLCLAAKILSPALKYLDCDVRSISADEVRIPSSLGKVPSKYIEVMTNNWHCYKSEYWDTSGAHDLDNRFEVLCWFKVLPKEEKWFDNVNKKIKNLNQIILQAMDVRYVLQYYYYGGSLYAALRNFSRALHFFEICLSVPSQQTTSAIQVTERVSPSDSDKPIRSQSPLIYIMSCYCVVLKISNID